MQILYIVVDASSEIDVDKIYMNATTAHERCEELNSETGYEDREFEVIEAELAN